MRNPLLALAAALCLLAGAARAQNPLVELVTQADSPSFLADPGDGRLFISELGGRIRIFANGQLQASNDAFLDIHTLIDFGSSGEGGLHSFAFDPGFATNGYFYVEYTRTGRNNSPLESVIARYTVASDPNHADPNSAQIVLTQLSPQNDANNDFSNHKGGQLQFGPDHLLYFAFGDGGSGNDPRCLSQTHGVLFGKMLRIDPSRDDFPADDSRNYAIPAGNPFLADPNYAPEIWALGLRNPYRYSFDRETGDLWIGDVGQSTREEVDMDAAPNAGRGKNYGWKMREGTTCHFADATAASCPAYVAPCDDPGYTDPVADYGRTVGTTVIGGYVYRGSVAAWRGRYIFADFGIGEIFALIHDGGGWTRQPLSSDVPSPISFGEDHTGELYALSIAGGVYRLRFDLVGLTKTQRDCVRKLNEDFLQIADAASGQIRSCIDQRARRKLSMNVDTCVDGDPRNQLEKLRAKAQKDDTKLCSQTPEVGYAGAGAGSAAALAAELDLAHDVFGASLDAAVVTTATERTVAACQKAVVTALASCQKVRRAEFLRCKKAGLKADTLLQSSDLAACLDGDPKAKARIANACDPAAGKLAKNAIAKSCVGKGVDLSTAFPGCDTGGDPAALATCLDQAGQCRNCQLFDAADALGTTCNTCAP